MPTLSIIMSIVLVIAVLLTVVYVISLKTREDELHKAEETLQEDRRNLDEEMQKFKTDQETEWLKLSAKQHELEEQKKEVERITENMYEMDRKVTEKYQKYGEPTVIHAAVNVKDGEKLSSARKRLASAVGYKFVNSLGEVKETDFNGKKQLSFEVKIVK